MTLIGDVGSQVRTAGTTQWRIESMQLVNWGGFQGQTTVALAATATLLSGASGTGKSTLLDGYLALMMESKVPFNGASNDSTMGRARSAGQRNLPSYIRGKVDSSRDGTEMTDQVLRGANGPTWSAVAATFVEDGGRRMTVLRAYYLPKGAQRADDVMMKMCVGEGFVDLKEFEPMAAERFERRAIRGRFPAMDVFDSYAPFAAALHARLGIGANGDGAKALRLLARIQAGHPVRTVDDLYKTMVIEEPKTYSAADKAVEHFTDLEQAYAAMVTEAEKEKVLRRLPDLHAEHEAALERMELIDEFGVNTDGPSRLRAWAAAEEDLLIVTAVEENLRNQAAQESTRAQAEAEERQMGRELADLEQAQREAGGADLKSLEREIERLDESQNEARRERDKFDDRTALLGVDIRDRGQFEEALRRAKEFIAGSDARYRDLDEERRLIGEQQWPLASERRELAEERASLQGRSGRVPRHLHEARVAVAAAVGLPVGSVPFVAELIDLRSGETRWRKAAEVSLSSLARVMLVDEAHLDRLSRAIDPIRLGTRLNFEGVPLQPFHERPADPSMLSGKLTFKDSPFSGWVQDRVSQANTDALCVESAADLGGHGRRVTVNGQTRQGKSGAHGETGSPDIIGFDNTSRIAEIDSRIADLDARLQRFRAADEELQHRVADLGRLRDAHVFLADATWDGIDYEGVGVQIAALVARRDAILSSNDLLRSLQEAETALRADHEQASRRKHAAEEAIRTLRELRCLLDEGLDRVRKDRHACAVAGFELTDQQNDYLLGEFSAVGEVTLDGFNTALARLANRLRDHHKGADQSARRAAEAITAIIGTYQDRWPNPDLGRRVESVGEYLNVLSEIISTGLHERRREWSRRLAEWSGQDLVPLAGAFAAAITDIQDRLAPVNEILAGLPFGANRNRLRIDLRRLTHEDLSRFQKELRVLSSGITTTLTDDETEVRFKRLQRFISLIRKPDGPAHRPAGQRDRDYYLDVRKHVEISASVIDSAGDQVATYTALGGKSGGETQELVAFVVGAALRFQLGDESRTRPRFAPVFLDEGFVKSDSEFAGRAVSAWKGLGFQLIIAAPLDKVTALEPHADRVLTMTKSKKGYSHITELTAPASP